MTYRERRRHRHRRRPYKVLLLIPAILLGAVLTAVLAAGSWVLDVKSNVPSYESLKPVDQGQSSVIFAADGTRLGFISSDEARTPVRLKRIPKHLQYATVAIEDERFFEHNGVDVEGVGRAALENLEAGKIEQGASTLTMQLVRNLYIADPERDLERKVTEAFLAWDVEDHRSKQWILDQYLNTASYGTINGRTAVGVQAASRTYFSKPVWKLNLEQSALLAGLPQSPSLYNPLLNPRVAKERRNEVLKRMADLGYISQRRARRGYATGLKLNESDIYTARHEPYFFDYVEQRLIDIYGVNTVRRGGLKVHTTIVPEYQEAGRAAIDSELYYPDDPEAALVAIDPDNGHILAMASSSDYEAEQYNLAAQGHRQPGSAFKTFVLTEAIDRGVDPYSTYYTSQHLELDLPEYGHWSVSTADEGYLGTVSIADATTASDNTVFAQLDLDLGPESVAEMAHKLGITTELDGIPAEGLGGLRLGVSPLEMASANATLAAGGVRHRPVAIRKVEFPDGRTDRPEGGKGKRVISDAVAYEVTQILRNNITGGTGTAAYTGCYGQAGKTGTTDSFNDAWFTGYQPNLATAVWVGYPDALRPMESVHGITVYGGTFPAEIWNNFYTGAGIPCEDFPPPTDTIEWSTFYGEYTSSGPGTNYSTSEDYDDTGDLNDAETGGEGGEESYDPDLYAPGAGQEPAPVPEPAPSPAPAPAPQPSPPPSADLGTGGAGPG